MVLLVSTATASWLGMQFVHEWGHVLGAKWTGGRVARVVLHPLTISRTDVAENPRPLAVVWAGPAIGALIPIALWGVAAGLRLPTAFLFRFFAGFCLIANGAYIAGGSFAGIGDCGEMLRHGSPLWTLWMFGLATVPAGFWLWHRQGMYFGLGEAGREAPPIAVCTAAVLAILLLVVGVVIDGR